MPPNEVDVIHLLATLLALVVSKEVAALLGPFAGIAAAAASGAALRCTFSDMKDRGENVRYLLVRASVALVLTGSIAYAIGWAWPSSWTPFKIPMLYLPIGFIIGAVRDIRDIKKLWNWWKEFRVAGQTNERE